MFYRDKTKFCSEPFCKDLQTNLDNYFSHRPTLPNENFNELFNLFIFYLFIYLSQTQKRPYMHTHAKKKKEKEISTLKDAQ